MRVPPYSGKRSLGSRAVSCWTKSRAACRASWRTRATRRGSGPRHSATRATASSLVCATSRSFVAVVCRCRAILVPLPEMLACRLRSNSGPAPAPGGTPPGARWRRSRPADPASYPGSRSGLKDQRNPSAPSSRPRSPLPAAAYPSGTVRTIFRGARKSLNGISACLSPSQKNGTCRPPIMIQTDPSWIGR